MPLQNILDVNPGELDELLLRWGYKSFHARQIWAWIYRKGARSFDQMSDLPSPLRALLKEHFTLYALKVVLSKKSHDGTEKFLLALNDGNSIEAVIIPSPKRISVCISTQVGCKFSCRFCASGLLGFKRNLTTAEILEEILTLQAALGDSRITHIVFMGTGEPLDNYDNVMAAIRIINDPDGLGIGARRITISTSGLVPGILRLIEEKMQVELSVSLHAANDSLRQRLMPINKKYPLKELLCACGEYIKKTNRQITFEYLLIHGLNCDGDSCQELSKLMRGLKLSKVNLIPANEVKEYSLKPPEKKETLFFKDCLVRAGVQVTLRKQRGADIDASCGQLRLTYGTH